MGSQEEIARHHLKHRIILTAASYSLRSDLIGASNQILRNKPVNNRKSVRNIPIFEFFDLITVEILMTLGALS